MHTLKDYDVQVNRDIGSDIPTSGDEGSTRSSNTQSDHECLIYAWGNTSFAYDIIRRAFVRYLSKLIIHKIEEMISSYFILEIEINSLGTPRIQSIGVQGEMTGVGQGASKKMWQSLG
ncbi:hypothetical protein ACJX0J_008698 [Zea mays]